MEIGGGGGSSVQIVQFGLRPLYDPEIPLETFLSPDLASSFRGALKNVTETEWAKIDVCNQNCTLFGDGVCITVPDISTKTVSYECVYSKPLPDEPPIQSYASDTTRAMQGRMLLSQGQLPPVQGVQFLQVSVGRHAIITGSSFIAPSTDLDDAGRACCAAGIQLLPWHTGLCPARYYDAEQQ